MKTIKSKDNEYTFSGLTLDELSALGRLFYAEKWDKVAGEFTGNGDALYQMVIPAKHEIRDGQRWLMLGDASIRPVFMYDTYIHYVDELIAERNEYRQNKQWDKADAVRDYLLGKGIQLHDEKDGTWWSRN